VVVWPLQDGVITDLETTRRFLREILHGIAPSWWQRRRLSVVVGVPAAATALERRALLEAAEEAGIGKAQLLPEPVCGAVGCGIDPLRPRSHLVVDVGGGTSEVAAFGSGGMLTYRSTPVAGCLEDLPPQSVADVMAEGVVVVGGGSLVPGFGKRLEDAFGFPVLMADQPLTRVAEGAARCLASPEALAAYAVT